MGKFIVGPFAAAVLGVFLSTLAAPAAAIGTIEGRVISEGSGGVPGGAQIVVFDERSESVAFTAVAADGSYSVPLLPAGTYRVWATSHDHLDELYDDRPCGDFDGCRSGLAFATPVEVRDGATTSGIDFALVPFGSIAGTVVDAATGQALAEGWVEIWHYVSQAVTAVGTIGADGTYRVDGLDYGSYAVIAGSDDHRPELWDDIPCLGGGDTRYGCVVADGQRVDVEDGRVSSGIDFALDPLDAVSGRISGQVRDAESGEPVEGVEIAVFGPVELYALTVTDASGRYTARGLPALTYRVAASQTVFPQYYQEQTYAEPVEVVEGEERAGIDFDLVPRGRIEGRVVEEGSGAGLAGAVVVAIDANGYVRLEAETDETGQYRVDSLSDGEYFVVADDETHLGRIYPDRPCLDSNCVPSSGQPVTATVGEITRGIDLALPLGGRLSGRVTDAATGAPLANASVTLRSGPRSAVTTETGADGVYTFVDLPGGDYFAVVFRGFFAAEVYGLGPCVGPECDATRGTPIPVVEGEETTNIDFALERPGRLSGRLLDAVTGAPVVGDAAAEIWSVRGTRVAFGVLSREGRYGVDLPAGNYFVSTTADGYRNELWQGREWQRGDDPNAGTPVQVERGEETSAIDFTLQPATGLRGRVVHAETGLGIADVSVDVWSPAFGALAFKTRSTGPDGSYIVPLDPGQYYVSTENFSGGQDEVFDDIPCPGGSASSGSCDPFQGTPVLVSEGQATPGIDFDLVGVQNPCQPSETTLCLGDSRFRVEATWRDGNGGSGVARVRRVTDDTGAFFFFDDENVEIVVKVLDACADPFDRYWVFAAGLTDVEVTLTVTDTLAIETRTYRSELSTPFQPVLDTDAFATCDR